MKKDIKQEIKEMKRKKIIEGAIKVFLDKGINDATMEDIAKEIGYGKASLYYYFSSKNEIISFILQEGWKRLKKAMEEGIKGEGTPREKFFRTVNMLFKVVFESPDLIKLLYTASVPDFLEEEVKKEIMEHRNYMVNLFERLIKEGKAKGEFKDVDVKVSLEAIFGMIKSFILAEGIKAKEKKKRKIEEFISDILIP